MTHWIESSELCRSFERSSSAMLTIVVSRTDMIAPRITTMAMRQTCGSMRGAGSAAVEEEEVIRCLKIRHGRVTMRYGCVPAGRDALRRRDQRRGRDHEHEPRQLGDGRELRAQRDGRQGHHPTDRARPR